MAYCSFSEQSASDPPPDYTTRISQQPVAAAHPMMPAVVPRALPKSLVPHNFLALSICIAVCFGVLNIVSLFCSIPAIVLSILVCVL